MMSRRLMAAAKTAAAILIVILTGRAATAQALSVLPVNIFLPPGQRATTLTVTNQGNRETAIQVRAYAWNQPDGEDILTSSDAVMVSPPLATIAPGATQVVRLILRLPPLSGDREATYRILVDQIPPPAEPGIVQVVLRLSIPIFALPTTRAASIVRYHIELNSGQIYLVGSNDGLRHEAIRDIVLSTGDGRKLTPGPGASPYVLSGATRRWPIARQGPLPLPGETLRLTAHSDSGAIEEQVSVAPAP
jgi:fimbrial chaperone protein